MVTVFSGSKKKISFVSEETISGSWQSISIPVGKIRGLWIRDISSVTRPKIEVKDSLIKG